MVTDEPSRECTCEHSREAEMGQTEKVAMTYIHYHV